MTAQDLQQLEEAARLIISTIERHRVLEENAEERRAAFRLIVPKQQKEKLPLSHRPAPTRQNKTLEDIKSMLIKLNIKSTARLRADGLYEIRPVIDGKRVSLYGRSAEELAQKYEKALKGRHKGPKIEKNVKISLYAWLDEWLEIYKKPNVATNTYNNLRRCVEKQIKSTLKDKSITQYTLTELTQALNQIETSRMRKYARGTLMAAFACAITAGHLKTSPAQNLLPVKHVAKKGKALSLLELKDMILRASDQLAPSMLHYYLFCLFAGTRRDEALYLTGADFDTRNKIIYVHGTKTVGSDRRLPMFPVLERIYKTVRPKKDARLFPVGKHRTNEDFKIFRGERTEAVLHWLRHTFGTIQICVLGIPANTVALWMGHADASTTVDIYTHPEDLAPDIYFSGEHSEQEKAEILLARYNEIVSLVEKLL